MVIGKGSKDYPEPRSNGNANFGVLEQLEVDG